MRPTFRSPDAPSASFTVPEVPNLSDAGEVQPILRERSGSPTDLVLEGHALPLSRIRLTDLVGKASLRRQHRMQVAKDQEVRLLCTAAP
jgi:hypothetical protein